MFKNEEVALTIKESIQNVNLLLLRSYIKVLDKHDDQNEKLEYKKKISLIQNLIIDSVLKPIYELHPELEEEEEKYLVDEAQPR